MGHLQTDQIHPERDQSTCGPFTLKIQNHPTESTMNYNLPTYQTAGYVQPLGHASGDDVRTQLTKGWAVLADVAGTARRGYDYQDQFRTGLHDLMRVRHASQY